MNFFEFIATLWTANAELTRAFAWPVVVLLSIWLLREPLIELIPALEKLKAGNFEFLFRETINRTKRDADDKGIPKLPEARATVTSKGAGQSSEFHVEIEKKPELPEFDPGEFLLSVNAPTQSPRWSIFQSLQTLQSDMNILLDHRPERDPDFTIPSRWWADVLKEEGYISDRTKDLIEGLYTARDFFLDMSPSIRTEDVDNFTKLVARARLAIRADYANNRADSTDVTADSTEAGANNQSNMP